MGVLTGAAAAACLALAACYAPAVRDCTISCTSPSDCATGQVCGSDGMCASPAVAGQCAARVDAGVNAPHDDAAPPAPTPDAGPPPPPPDAGRTVRLTVQVVGKGAIAVDGAGTCSSQDATKGSCAYDVAAGTPLSVQATPVDGDDPFSMWTSIACAGQGAHCVFTPVIATTVSGRFVHSNMHGPM